MSTSNPALLLWIKEMETLCGPSKVHWCDGSESEKDLLTKEAAATGEISGGGWALFAIQFFWQIPHFLAISWLYREDYARAGFKMLAVTDTDGGRTGHQAVSHALGLLAVSLCPFVFRVAGPVYLLGALVLGMMFLWFSVRFARGLRRENARSLFLVSIIYLPLVLGLIVMDKVG